MDIQRRQQNHFSEDPKYCLSTPLNEMSSYVASCRIKFNFSFEFKIKIEGRLREQIKIRLSSK